MNRVNIFWFRRDLRLTDNPGLYHALRSGIPVLPVFIFDEYILSKLEDRRDGRVNFIYTEISSLKKQIESSGSDLIIKHGKPESIFRELINTYQVDIVYANHDYEPYARKRDSLIKDFLQRNNIDFITYKDHVIFEKDEVLKDSGGPYTVFTPYSKKWKTLHLSSTPDLFHSENFLHHFARATGSGMPSLASIGFEKKEISVPSREFNEDILRSYHETRDFPYLGGTSRLGIHLRFGTVSIRKLVSVAAKLNEVYLNELIWREFYMMILWHFPHVVEGSFKSQYDLIAWRNNEREFAAWCSGMTGYPIVDAGMRELNQTGYMHNRSRMITASFLAKHLLIDWRWGEAYFAGKLLDYELASNNGGWQWAAGTGCDAAPYFRVFNPDLQTAKFDPDKKYIRQWVPEYSSRSYPKPVVEHAKARKEAISAYKKALLKNI